MASPFGQAPAAGAFGKPFAFGTPGATPGLFGASPSTPGFGGTPTPGFGAAPSTFGAPTGGFGFTAASSAAAFGAASTPAFGATPTAASTPAFGAFSFNTAASAASGASSASPFAPSAAPMFGGNTFGQSSPGLFGSSPAPPFGSSFGAASSAAGFSFSTTGAFGSPAPAALAQSGGGMFGATTQMAPALFSTGAAPDAAIKEMGEVRAAYMPSSSTFKFQHLFLNVVDNPAQRVKPANVDEIRWRQVMAQAGGPNNPDKLWPVLAVGFKDLLSRAAAQQQGIEENQQRLKSLTELAHRMSRQHTIELKGRTADVQKRHIELSHRLLHVTRLLDALESRLASSLGYRGDLSRSKEQDLSRQLAGVETEVAPGSTSGLQRRLQTVSSAARLRSGLAPGGGASAQAKLDEKSLQQLFAVLKEHAEGVRQLQEVLKRDQLDIQIMKQHVGQGA